MLIKKTHSERVTCSAHGPDSGLLRTSGVVYCFNCSKNNNSVNSVCYHSLCWCHIITDKRLEGHRNRQSENRRESKGLKRTSRH